MWACMTRSPAVCTCDFRWLVNGSPRERMIDEFVRVSRKSLLFMEWAAGREAGLQMELEEAEAA